MHPSTTQAGARLAVQRQLVPAQFRAPARRARACVSFPGQEDLYLTTVSLLLETQKGKAFNNLLYLSVLTVT